MVISDIFSKSLMEIKTLSLLFIYFFYKEVKLLLRVPFPCVPPIITVATNTREKNIMEGIQIKRFIIYYFITKKLERRTRP
jgi:hypothetical protein